MMISQKVLSYNNDINLKNLVVSEMKNHQKKDSFIKGTYGYVAGAFKGCAVGCTINSINKVLGENYNIDSHAVLQEVIGIPAWLAKLQNSFFELLSSDECSQFAIDFLESIPVGVDLESVRGKFNAMILKESIEKLKNNSKYLKHDVSEQVLNSLINSLHINESSVKSGGWNPDISCKELDNIKIIALRASIYGNNTDGRMINVARLSLESDDDSSHRMVFSAALECPNNLEMAYKGYSNDLINLLKNQEASNTMYN